MSDPQGIKTREQITAEAKRIRKEIGDYLDDCDHYNRVHPLKPMDPDPDGDVARLAAGLDATLAREEQNKVQNLSTSQVAALVGVAAALSVTDKAAHRDEFDGLIDAGLLERQRINGLPSPWVTLTNEGRKYLLECFE